MEPASPGLIHPKARGLALGVVFLTLPSVSTTTAADWTGKREVRDGVTHVWNPSKPLDGAVAYDLREQWRLESENEQGEVVFAVISSVAEDPAGNVYLLDPQLKTVHVISPQGEHLRRIGREGQGPGEFENPSQVIVDEQGRVAVVDLSAGRVHYFTSDGLPLDPWQAAINAYPDCYLGQLHPMPLGGFAAHIVARQRSETEMRQRDILGVLGPDGDLIAEILQTEQIRYRGEPYCYDEEYDSGLSLFGVTRDSRILASSSHTANAYRVFGADGAPVAVVEWDGQRAVRSVERITELETYWRGYFRQRKELRLEISPVERSVYQVIERSDGSLWVRTALGMRDLASGQAEVVDVYDTDGHFRQRAVLEHEFSEADDVLYLLSQRVLISVGGFSSDMASRGGATDGSGGDAGAVPAVICCEPIRER